MKQSVVAISDETKTDAAHIAMNAAVAQAKAFEEKLKIQAQQGGPIPINHSDPGIQRQLQQHFQQPHFQQHPSSRSQREKLLSQIQAMPLHSLGQNIHRQLQQQQQQQQATMTTSHVNPESVVSKLAEYPAPTASVKAKRPAAESMKPPSTMSSSVEYSASAAFDKKEANYNTAMTNLLSLKRMLLDNKSRLYDLQYKLDEMEDANISQIRKDRQLAAIADTGASMNELKKLIVVMEAEISVKYGCNMFVGS